MMVTKTIEAARNSVNGNWPILVRVVLALAVFLISIFTAISAAYLFTTAKSDAVRQELQQNLSNAITAERAFENRVEERLDVIAQSVTRIEGNRFTSRDGMQMMDRIAGVEKEFSAHKHEAPPAWVLERLSHLEERIKSVEGKQ